MMLSSPQTTENNRSKRDPSIKRKVSLLEKIMIFMCCRSHRDGLQTSNFQLINQPKPPDLKYYQEIQFQFQDKDDQILRQIEKMTSKYGSQAMSGEFQPTDETRCSQNYNSVDNRITTTTTDQQVTTSNNQIITASTMDAAEQDSQKSTETMVKQYSSLLSNNTDHTDEIFNNSLFKRFSLNQTSIISNQSNFSSTSSARSANSVIEVADKNWMSRLIANLYNENQVIPPSNEVGITVTHHEGNNLSFNITKQGTRKHYEFHVTLLRKGQDSDNTTFEFNRRYRDLEVKYFYDIKDDNVLYLCAIHKANQ